MKRKQTPKLPPVALVRAADTHHLVSSRYGDSPDGALTRLSEEASQLDDLADLKQATDERLLAEHNLLPAISVNELVFGIPHAGVINAAFTHAHPLGSRFNSADRGAWYAAFRLATAQAEIGFHRTVHLAEIGRYEDEACFDDYLADFNGEFHDLRRAKGFGSCLDPASYVASQTLAEGLLEEGSLGVVYPSVRHPRATCLVSFHPALVSNVRRGRRYRFRWSANPKPVIDTVASTSGSGSR